MHNTALSGTTTRRRECKSFLDRSGRHRSGIPRSETNYSRVDFVRPVLTSFDIKDQIPIRLEWWSLLGPLLSWSRFGFRATGVLGVLRFLTHSNPLADNRNRAAETTVANATNMIAVFSHRLYVWSASEIS